MASPRITVVRNQKIIELWTTGHTGKQIKEILVTLGYGEVSQSTISDQVRFHENEVGTSTYNSKRAVGTEKSLVRQRNESTYLRKINRDILKETIKEEDIYESVARLISQEVKPLKIPKVTIKKNNKLLNTKIFHLTDIHLGKRGTSTLSPFESKTILERFEMMVQDMVNSKETNIIVACTGDLFEVLSQVEMHSGQRLMLEFQSPDDNILFAVKLFTNMYNRLLAAGKTVTNVFMGGNHDRFSSHNGDDYLRMGMFVFVEIMKATFKDSNMVWHYTAKDLHLVVEFNDFILVIAHGEGTFNKRNGDQIRQELRLQTSKYVIILSGHRHTPSVGYSLNTLKAIGIGMAGVGEYDKSLRLNSNSGYGIVTWPHGTYPSYQVVITD